MKSKFTKTCPRCNGKGYIGAFAHVESGLCFCCKGNKVIKTTEEEYNQIIKTIEILNNPVIEWKEEYGKYTGKHETETYFISRTRISLGYGKTKPGFSASVVGKKYDSYNGIFQSFNTIEEAKAICERYAQNDFIPNILVQKWEAEKRYKV